MSTSEQLAATLLFLTVIWGPILGGLLKRRK